MERYADSLVAAPIRSSAGRARRASSLRPMAVAPSWVIVGPARKLPPWSRLTKPALSSVRLLRTLESAGFVSRDHGGSFRAGPTITQLGATAIGRNELARLARPALDRIGAATRESAYLSIRGVGDTAVYIAQVEGTHAVRHSSWIGRAVHMEGLAVGQVLRGEIPEMGYVAGRDRLEPDVTAIVAPVRYPGGIAGALSVLGPTYRIDKATMHAYGRIVATEAAELSSQLGSTPDEQENRR